MTVAAKHAAGTENPYTLPHLDALESEAVHIFREVVGEFERPVILFSGGKDSIVMLHLALKAFARRRCRSRCFMWTPDTTFPRSLSTATVWWPHMDYGSMWPPYRTTSTGVCCANVPTGPATRSRRSRSPRRSRASASTRCSVAVVGTRRRPAPRSGCSRCGTSSGRGSRVAAARTVEPLQRPPRARRTRPRLPALQLDRTGRLAVHRPRGHRPPDIYYAHEREVFRRGELWLTPGSWGGPGDGETVEKRQVRYRTVGDMSCTGAVDSSAVTIEQVIDEITASRLTERVPPGPTTSCPRPPWRTASARGISDHGHHHRHIALRHGGLRRRRQVHARRTAAARLQVGPHRPTRGRGTGVGEPGTGRPRPRAPHGRAARRARAGHHHRRGLPLLRHASQAVHPRRHPRARAVHPQHGHRCLHRRADGGPRRRAQRCRRTDPPPCRHRRAAAGPARRPRRQQNGPRRLPRARIRHHRRGVHGLRQRTRHPRGHRDPHLGAGSATTS